MRPTPTLILTLAALSIVLGCVNGQASARRAPSFPWNQSADEVLTTLQQLEAESRNGEVGALRDLFYYSLQFDSELAQHCEDSLLRVLGSVGAAQMAGRLSVEPHSVRENIYTTFLEQNISEQDKAVFVRALNL